MQYHRKDVEWLLITRFFHLTNNICGTIKSGKELDNKAVPCPTPLSVQYTNIAFMRRWHIQYINPRKPMVITSQDTHENQYGGETNRTRIFSVRTTLFSQCHYPHCCMCDRGGRHSFLCNDVLANQYCRYANNIYRFSLINIITC